MNKSLKQALIIQPVAFEDLGTLAPTLQSAGYQTRLLAPGYEPITTEAINDPDLLILLGGPISVNDTGDYPFIVPLCRMLADRLTARRPVFGICLGAQLIAKALGANVQPSPVKEIGWSELTLTDAGQRSCLRYLKGIEVLHWHGEIFDLPFHAEHLASTAICNNQAFQLGRHVLALQFHIEPNACGLERWYIGHTLELSKAGISVPSLRNTSQTRAPLLAEAAKQCFNEWLLQLE